MRNYLTAFFTLLTVVLIGQPRFPALSPEGSIRQKVGLTTISVTYERPAARGRTIFGELVPYGKLWRTGAGNCTKIKIGDDVVVNNKIIPSGTYSLFTIPDQNEWTIILNSDTTLYGTQGYHENRDIVRFKTKSEMTGRYYESFTVDIDVTQDDAELNLSWEKTRVTFRIETETDEKVMRMVNKDLLSGKIKDPQLLAMGAEYFAPSQAGIATTALTSARSQASTKPSTISRRRWSSSERSSACWLRLVSRSSTALWARCSALLTPGRRRLERLADLARREAEHVAEDETARWRAAGAGAPR